MPEYIASGKDLYGESSLKVSADSDHAAFAEAKKVIPVIYALERIEPNGDLMKIEGLPFDDIRTPLISLNEKSREQANVLLRQKKHGRVFRYSVVFFVFLAAIESCKFMLDQKRKEDRLPRPDTTAPAEQPQTNPG